MGAGHSHDHGAAAGTHGTAGGAHRGRLRFALCMTVTVLLAEVAGSFVTGSLALLADAGHMATDALGLGMALVAVHFANKPAAGRRTFGYARAEILAAMANAVLLFGVGLYILVEAVRRFLEPVAVAGGATVLFGLVGLVANSVSVVVLLGGQRESLNTRGAFLEVLADALGSAAVVVSALIILGTGWTAADPIASIAIGLMVVPRTWSLLREAVDVLLEAAPRNVDLDEVRAHMLALPGVTGLHDLHVWTVTSGLPVISVHVVVTEEALRDQGHEGMLHTLQECLGAHFDVGHCTFQLEPEGHAAHEPSLCH
ncbi:cation diffusion facilitator family transporter [Streptomyces sp. NPDC092296]|uniref:cation diffusion facilitator family transporter n=1 Tax=Streptomyces sp. NPDC092296 TaxID=3366012 RepID=UPI0038049B0C